MGIKSYAVLGFRGGTCKKIADVPIHFAIEDMQISEDLQLVVGHMIMQWLHANPPHSLRELRTHRERPHRRATNKGNELPPLH